MPRFSLASLKVRQTSSPSRLSVFLTKIRAEPKPVLPSVRSVNVKYSTKFRHIGARYFVRKDFPVLAYHNRGIKVSFEQVKARKPRRDGTAKRYLEYPCEMLVTYSGGESHKEEIGNLTSDGIMKRLIKAVGEHQARVAAELKKQGKQAMKATPKKGTKQPAKAKSKSKAPSRLRPAPTPRTTAKSPARRRVVV